MRILLIRIRFRIPNNGTPVPYSPCHPDSTLGCLVDSARYSHSVRQPGELCLLPKLKKADKTIFDIFRIERKIKKK
jgi:hypothetical protein